MKFVALLRGINVGGNCIIKMTDLKTTFESLGYEAVTTLIQSGNVIFTSNNTSERITEELEARLSKKFGYGSKVVVLTESEFRNILKNVPDEWKNKNDIRCYIAFLKYPLKSSEVTKEIVLTKNVDFLKEGEKAVYMTTVMSGLMKSGFKKLIGKAAYKNMTMRNYNTAQRLLTFLE